MTPRHAAPDVAYVLVKLHPNLVVPLRNMIHESRLAQGDIVFYDDARNARFIASTRDSALAKFESLDTAYQTVVSYLKRKKSQ